MLDIMKSIYDMMGKYTYPTMQDDAPREHVENFFQVRSDSLNIDTSVPSFIFRLFSFFQKMDRNKDGVVTIDEFIESCKKVILTIRSSVSLCLEEANH